MLIRKPVGRDLGAIDQQMRETGAVGRPHAVQIVQHFGVEPPHEQRGLHSE